MRDVLAIARYWAAKAEDASRIFGSPIRIDAAQSIDRGSEFARHSPGLWSANRHARMVRALDGWLAVNLARSEDRTLLPAWLEREIDDEPWQTVVSFARQRRQADLLARARLLGLPVSIVGEVAAAEPIISHRLGVQRPRYRRLRVIDLTSLWAGPLCTALLARAGMEVVRYEDPSRPDSTKHVAPRFHERLNGAKKSVAMAFGSVELADAIADADVVVTNSRQRAFAAVGLSPYTMFARNPGLIWIAISGHGWTGEMSDRVAFGDDAAAAGGLVRWTSGRAPRFIGDALADPLAGLAAASAAMRAVAEGGGVLLDIALSRVTSHKPDA